jgi:signal transduction histidine kinase
VTVTAYTADDRLVMRVADTGSGLDPAHADLVFQRGFSTKPDGPGGRGRGLGLALVRQAVHRHGGTLTVAEADGGGAVFEAGLPLASVPVGARP